MITTTAIEIQDREEAILARREFQAEHLEKCWPEISLPRLDDLDDWDDSDDPVLFGCVQTAIDVFVPSTSRIRRSGPRTTTTTKTCCRGCGSTLTMKLREVHGNAADVAFEAVAS